MDARTRSHAALVAAVCLAPHAFAQQSPTPPAPQPAQSAPPAKGIQWTTGDYTWKAGGYIKVKPAKATKHLPILDDGTEHELRAEIIGDSLYAWIDGSLAWQGRLPSAARDLAGPAGVRSDNLDFELTAFDAPDLPETIAAAAPAPAPKCVPTDETD